MNLPVEFEGMMKDMLGTEYQEFRNSLEEKAKKSIRINPKKYRDSLRFNSVEKVPWNEQGWVVPNDYSFLFDPRFHAGAYYVQESSSMFIDYVIRQIKYNELPVKVLDLCASPGGKSTQLLSAINRESILISNEAVRSRISPLVENIQKWGYDNVIVTNNDPKDFGAIGPIFDLVLVDAPCSGEGMFRKEAAALDAWSTKTVEFCSARQRRIVEDALPTLKEGGYLIYSTCTFNEEENEQVLETLIKSGQFEPVNISPPATWGVTVSFGVWGNAFRFYPHKVSGEGLFVGILRKVFKGQFEIKLKKSKPYFERIRPTDRNQMNEWITNSEQITFLKHKEIAMVFPSEYFELLEYIKSRLSIVYAGVHLATSMRNDWIPMHPGAQAVLLNHNHFKSNELNEKEAIAFLRKEFYKIPDESSRGYELASFEGYNLGWLKAVGNRFNNLYPSERRILKSSSF